MTITTANDAPMLDSLREVLDNATVGKVFGSPIHHDGVLVLPVAKIGSGGGGGSGTGPAPEGQEAGGTGGGFGVSAKPLGVFVVKNGQVSWQPALDLNRIILGAQVVAVTGLFVLRMLLRARQATDVRR
ncbi:spore germination protein GerW family protein [Actinoplanes sp. NPDC051859]|uniref:spore germination protein GerW family protein n=1 Tax=Actinoplanes sp. NPDC051859 TaxID=3363909 RepID=UPI00379F8FD0